MHLVSCRHIEEVHAIWFATRHPDVRLLCDFSRQEEMPFRHSMETAFLFNAGVIQLRLLYAPYEKQGGTDLTGARTRLEAATPDRDKCFVIFFKRADYVFHCPPDGIGSKLQTLMLRWF